MPFIDTAVIVLYFILVIGLGLCYKKYAARNLEAYFLGGKNLHWAALSMSGSVSNFDITGTMWIVSILFLLGFKSMWHHWMWGFLMGAFFMSYMGKWVRRSKVMTAAEWMKTRFGTNTDGKLARTAYAVMAIITLTSFIGYAFQGIGKFASVYIPLERLAGYVSSPFLQQLFTLYEPQILAVVVISITTLYVLLGGLYSVVFTDVIQTLILTVGSLIIAWIAWSSVTPEMLSDLPENWTSLKPPWKLSQGAAGNNAQFEMFGALVIVWVLKGFLLNAGGPAQMYDFQRFLAARHARDAAKVGAAWSVFLVVRWGMAMAIVLLAFTGIGGVEDTEQVMPLVLRDFLPAGLRGLVIAGLLAAFMSTFSSTVNCGASFLIRDIWEPYLRKDDNEQKSIRMSYLATVSVVLVGIAIGFQARSIAEIWNWIMMALGAGVIVPNVLRWYWWRFNGWGYTWGLFGGILLSLVVLFFPDMPIYYSFPLICAGSTLLSIIATLKTKQVDEELLIEFYTQVRPFGCWGPVRRKATLSISEQTQKSESASRSIINVVIASIAIIGFYLFPMYLVGHWYDQALFWFGTALIAALLLYFTWYRYLPQVREDE
jgi:solute:Na+ symporter, SSS family